MEQIKLKYTITHNKEPVCYLTEKKAKELLSDNKLKDELFDKIVNKWYKRQKLNKEKLEIIDNSKQKQPPKHQVGEWVKYLEEAHIIRHIIYHKDYYEYGMHCKRLFDQKIEDHYTTTAESKISKLSNKELGKLFNNKS